MLYAIGQNLCIWTSLFVLVSIKHLWFLINSSRSHKANDSVCRATRSANENLLYLLPVHEGHSVQSAHSKAEVHRAVSLGLIQHLCMFQTLSHHWKSNKDLKPFSSRSIVKKEWIWTCLLNHTLMSVFPCDTSNCSKIWQQMQGITNS